MEATAHGTRALQARAPFRRRRIYPHCRARETGSGKTSLPAVPGPGLNQWTWLLPASWSRNLWAKQTPGTVHGKSRTSPSGRVSRGSQAPAYPVPGTQENLCPPPPLLSRPAAIPQFALKVWLLGVLVWLGVHCGPESSSDFSRNSSVIGSSLGRLASSSLTPWRSLRGPLPTFPVTWGQTPCPSEPQFPICKMGMTSGQGTVPLLDFWVIPTEPGRLDRELGVCVGGCLWVDPASSWGQHGMLLPPFSLPGVRQERKREYRFSQGRVDGVGQGAVDE